MSKDKTDTPTDEQAVSFAAEALAIADALTFDDVIRKDKTTGQQDRDQRDSTKRRNAAIQRHMQVGAEMARALLPAWVNDAHDALTAIDAKEEAALTRALQEFQRHGDGDRYVKARTRIERKANEARKAATNPVAGEVANLTRSHGDKMYGEALGFLAVLRSVSRIAVRNAYVVPTDAAAPTKG